MAASDKKPTIYSNRDNTVSYSMVPASLSDTEYQPFKGFYVKTGGVFNYMDWDGNLVALGTVTAGQLLWISGQRILVSTSASVLISQ